MKTKAYCDDEASPQSPRERFGKKTQGVQENMR